MTDFPTPDEQNEFRQYLDQTDEDVVLLAQNGDGQALAYLLNKYKNFVRSKARSYFLVPLFCAYSNYCRCNITPSFL